jgi:hypothetical protein
MLHAQWISYETPGVPRTADGKVNLTAPVARTHDGKPDLIETFCENEKDLNRMFRDPLTR